MAPLAVDEKYRGQGLARQLVYEGLDSLNEFGYAAVVTLGDPALYSRFVLNWPRITIFTAVGPVRKALSRYTVWLRMRWRRDGAGGVSRPLQSFLSTGVCRLDSSASNASRSVTSALSGAL
ncbi:acetyltransferase [Salmonella enterica subsp. enterica]|uniref:Acetyltransferase n=1 Tax=Salmonella enterica I TaxID=59201 RepID=A0A379W2F3_SALET|nr:acetyltransferase [Salmonella enterica subsp. enterica]